MKLTRLWFRLAAPDVGVCCAALRGPGYTTAPAVNVIIGGDTEPQRQGDWVDNPAPGNPVAAPMLSAMPAGYASAPAGLMSPQVGADPPIAPRPYGTPVPGGVLIGADISMQIRVRGCYIAPFCTPLWAASWSPYKTCRGNDITLSMKTARPSLVICISSPSHCMLFLCCGLSSK